MAKLNLKLLKIYYYQTRLKTIFRIFFSYFIFKYFNSEKIYGMIFKFKIIPGASGSQTIFEITTVNLSILARYHYRSISIPSFFRYRPVLKFQLLSIHRPPSVQPPSTNHLSYRYRPFIYCRRSIVHRYSPFVYHYRLFIFRGRLCNGR